MLHHIDMPRSGIMRVWAVVAILSAMAACNGVKSSGGQFIPDKPDYSDSALWFVRENDASGTGADVFYLVSTWEADWTAGNGKVCHYADVYKERHRSDMDKEIAGVAEYMGEGNNFYSPYYRHTTIEAWETRNEDTIASRFRIPSDDIKQAFRVFLKRRDPHRPFILAGFSQGAKGVVELLKCMPEDLHEYLVAAYVLGYKVTPDDTLATSNIRPAKGASDTGVTICYNSVSGVEHIKPVISVPCAMCINPVNWRTDSVAATLHDTISVSMSPMYNVLVLDGYDGKEYAPIRGFLNVGDFHGCEPWLYRECLRENIRERIDAYYGMAR